MSATSLAEQIADQLAGARCEQDLDYELANIPEAHWHLFVEHMNARILALAEKEPERAGALRSLLHTYQARWHRKKRSGFA
ncbi:MAG TPA: hypothetical protein VF646_05825, partial [Cytophagales bacterium]|jgi:hypothetical protein